MKRGRGRRKNKGRGHSELFPQHTIKLIKMHGNVATCGAHAHTLTLHLHIEEQ